LQEKTAVRLSQPRPAVAGVVTWNISRTAKGAFNALAVVFRGITSAVIWLFIFIPFWLLLGVVVYGYRRYSRRRQITRPQ